MLRVRKKVAEVVVVAGFVNRRYRSMLVWCRSYSGGDRVGADATDMKMEMYR
jgi:hypothetical protein